MRSSVALRILTPVLAAVLGAQALAGCAAVPARPAAVAIPLPSRALLAAPPPPDCEFRRIGLGDTVLDGDEPARRKLEHERQCYRRAEMKMRARLRRLQTSVAATVKAISDQ
jgi:CHASE2 domain-containing sensor protein